MWDISREEQDNYALQSQRKCENARSAGHFNAEIVPVTVQKKKRRCQIYFILISRTEDKPEFVTPPF